MLFFSKVGHLYKNKKVLTLGVLQKLNNCLTRVFFGHFIPSYKHGWKDKKCMVFEYTF